MIEVALIILLALFLLGFVKIPGVTIPNYILFTYHHHTITLFHLLTVVVIFGMLTFLPRFLRVIVGTLLIIWIIAILGIVTIEGLPLITIILMMVVVSLHRSFHWYHRYRRREY